MEQGFTFRVMDQELSLCMEVKIKRIYDDYGRLMYEIEILNGQSSGIKKAYHESNGKMYYIVNQIVGRYTGIFQKWNYYGNRSYIYLYKSHEMNGPQMSFRYGK